MLLYILFSLLLASSILIIFYQHQRNKRFTAEIHKAREQADVLQAEITKSRRQQALFEDRCKEITNQLRASDEKNSREQAKSLQRETELIANNNLLQKRLTNAELQRDHILNRFENLTQEVGSHQKNFEVQIENLRADAIAKEQSQHDLRRTVSELTTELNDLRLSKRQLIDPKTFESMRRRASANEQMYQSMRSLRDLHEERNKNWETALILLSKWILTSSHLAQSNNKDCNIPIGPLVGEALEAIGASLINDDEDNETIELSSESEPMVTV